MVIGSILLVLVGFLTTLANAAPLGERTVTQVVTDINTIASDANALEASVEGFSGSLTQALAIHTGFNNINSAIDQTITDVEGTTGPIGESDGTSILQAVQDLEPSIIDLLEALATKKPAFQALPLGGIPALIKSDISTLCTDLKALEDPINDIMPSDLAQETARIWTPIDAECSKVIAIYSDL